MAALRTKSVSKKELPEVMGWPADPERAERVASTVVSDGLAIYERDTFSLP